MTTLEALYQALQQEFQPLNEDFKLAQQWRSLHQRHDLNSYRQEVYQLKGHFPFDEVAEFYLTLLGLRAELRAPVVAELRRTNARHLSLPRLFELASHGDTSTVTSLFPRTWERLHGGGQGYR